MQITREQLLLKLGEFAETARIVPDDEEERIALVLLAGDLGETTDLAQIAQMTEIPDQAWLAELATRLHQAGIWTEAGSQTECYWQEDGVMALWCDVLVAQGRAARSTENGQIRWTRPTSN